jgi:hypothetical protein
MVGYIPHYLHEDDPRPAKEQFHENYAHGGGWFPLKGHKLDVDKNFQLKYPEDPPIYPIAMIRLRNERIFIYPHAWVMILQEDNTFEIARMD